MLESADHLIEKHRGTPALFDHVTESPYVPEGWILYSAECSVGGVRKSWSVELMDTTRPYQDDSIVSAQNNDSLDGALREAGFKIQALRPAGRG